MIRDNTQRGPGRIARLGRHNHCAYNLILDIDFDPSKNARNVRSRGLSFERAVDFAFETALVAVDERVDYRETRYVAIGNLDQRLHVLCFVETEQGIRVISFRKANAREVRRYEQATNPDR